MVFSLLILAAAIDAHDGMAIWRDWRKPGDAVRRVPDAASPSEPDEQSAWDEDPAERFERALLAVF